MYHLYNHIKTHFEPRPTCNSLRLIRSPNNMKSQNFNSFFKNWFYLLKHSNLRPDVTFLSSPRNFTAPQKYYVFSSPVRLTLKSLLVKVTITSNYIRGKMLFAEIWIKIVNIFMQNCEYICTTKKYYIFSSTSTMSAITVKISVPLKMLIFFIHQYNAFHYCENICTTKNTAFFHPPVQFLS